MNTAVKQFTNSESIRACVNNLLEGKAGIPYHFHGRDDQVVKLWSINPLAIAYADPRTGEVKDYFPETEQAAITFITQCLTTPQKQSTNTAPKHCFECRAGEHANFDDDVCIAVVVDPDTKKLYRRGYLCGEHRAVFRMDGFTVIEK